MKQFVVTSSMGKRLIGKGIAGHPAVRTALREGTVVIVAGTTNGYVAEEVLAAMGQTAHFDRKGFRRGMVAPPSFDAGPVRSPFGGDVVLVKGAYVRGKEIFDVVNDLGPGDVILKGANAVDLAARQAAVLIGHPMGGTIGATIPAVIGRRVRLIVPVGMEKRVPGPLADLAAALNDPAGEGPRLAIMPGEVFTELDAIALLTGATARLVAAGGIHGAEGAVWLAVTGTADQETAAETLIRSVANEPPCEA